MTYNKFEFLIKPTSSMDKAVGNGTLKQRFIFASSEIDFTILNFTLQMPRTSILQEMSHVDLLNNYDL